MPSKASAYEWRNGNEVWCFDVFQQSDGEFDATITDYRQVDANGDAVEFPDNLAIIVPDILPVIWTNEFGHLENVFEAGNYVSSKFVTTYGPEVANISAKVTQVQIFGTTDGREKLVSVTFPDSVVWVAGFDGCTNLASVTLSDDATIAGAFRNSPWLLSKGDFVIRNNVLVAYQGSQASVTVPDGVESIGAYAFCAGANDELTNLTSVTLPESVEVIDQYAFAFCEKLSAINIPKGVTDIGHYAFDWCESLASVELPEGLEQLGSYAFRGTALNQIAIPEGIEWLYGTFSDCANLTTVTFPKSLEEIGDYTFDACPALASITIPDSVRSIGDCAFNGAISLTRVDLPDSLEWIGYSAFKNCAKLATVTGGENVDEMGPEVFADTALYNNVVDGIVQAGTLVVGYNGTLPATLEIPNGATYVACSAFYNANITSLVLPASVRTIGDDAFYNCTALAKVTGGEGVQTVSIYDAFGGTPYWDTISQDCDKDGMSFSFVRLGSVILSYRGVCPAAIEIPDGVTQIYPRLFNIDDGYVTPSNITSVTIGADVREIGDDAFNGLENLATVTGGGAIEHVGSWTFAHCPNLTDVSLAGPLVWLEPAMFYQDFNLKNVAFDLVEPEDGAEFFLGTDIFNDCDKLASVTVTFDGYTLEGWEARGPGPAFETYDDELATYRLNYRVWYSADWWYPALLNLRPIWNGGFTPPDDPTHEEPDANGLAFGPYEGSQFFITETEEAHVVGVYGLKWSDFVKRDDGFSAFADSRVVDREKGSGSDAADHTDCVTYSDMDALVWAGWTKYAGFADEDAYANAWLSDDDSFKDAYKCAKAAGKDIYADYYEDVVFDSSFAATLADVFSQADRLMPMIVMFGDDYNWYGDVGAIDHAVVCCGYSLDTAKPLTDPTCLKGLFIIDPDNDRENNGGRENAPDTITYCPTVWDAANGQYEIQGIFGATGYVGEYASCYTISTPVELEPRWSTAAYVPEDEPSPTPPQPSGSEQPSDQKPQDSTQTQEPMPTLWGTVSDAGGQTDAAVQGQVPDGASSVYDGFLLDANGNVVGTVKAKVSKAKNGVAKVSVTIVPAAGKKTTVKGTLSVATGKVNGMDLVLGANGMTGTYGAYTITGSRNLFSSKSEKDAANDMLKPWLGPVNVAWRAATSESAPYHALTVTVANKGKIKVSGVLADGTKVSANSQIVIGEEWLCAPVTWAKKGKNLAFTMWLAKAGGKVLVYGIDDAIAGKPGTLMGGAKFHVDASSAAGMVNGALAEYLPDGLAVSGGTTWTVAKAGSISYKNGAFDTTKAGGNPSGLKLTYKSKDGTFKGSFTLYSLQGGKLKKVKANVAGVVVGGIGYGSATVKKSGSSVAVTIGK